MSPIERAGNCGRRLLGRRSSMKAALLVLALAGFGCSAGTGNTKPVRLSLHPMKIGEHEFHVELATDPDRRAVGLMYRKSLPEDQGMLFIFPRPQMQSFYMKNCEIDLEIAYIDDDGKIVDLLEMKAPPSGFSGPYRKYRSTEPVRYALEMNNGWFSSRGIGVGTVVEGLRPPGVRIQ